MQENYLFEYAVIRVVPRMEREEFLNVGVVLYCGKRKFLECRYHLDEGRLLAFSPSLDPEELQEHLNAVDAICKGAECRSPIAKLDAASRFRWLTATRSTVVQASKVHPGLSPDPAATLDKLFQELVL